MDRNLRSKLWIFGFIITSIIPLSIAAYWVIKIDPFFHYHKPDTSAYFYPLNNQRSQNDGISKHFDYEGLITGTSMTENFKTSEAEELFGCSFIKVPYSGGTYKEINDNLKVALSHNKNLKIVIRGLDMYKFFDDKDAMRTDLGKYPIYLYNSNPVDDIQYIFNRDVLSRVYYITISNDNDEFDPGITSFDSYGYWGNGFKYGANALLPSGIEPTDNSTPQPSLSENEKNTIIENVSQNITSLAIDNPDVTFYYFFTPHSAVWWQSLIKAGTLVKQLQAERIVIEEILKIDNIKLYSFNNLTDITTDLNNYKDYLHYGEWINSLMLRYMKDGKCLLTKSNYVHYLNEEEKFYRSFNYEKCFSQQKDYEDDYYQATLYLTK